MDKLPSAIHHLKHGGLDLMKTYAALSSNTN